MRNKLSDLNNYLFAQLERLDDESVTGDDLDEAIKRGNAIADVSTQIVATATIQLKAASLAYDMGIELKSPSILTLTETSEE